MIHNYIQNLWKIFCNFESKSIFIDYKGSANIFEKVFFKILSFLRRGRCQFWTFFSPNLLICDQQNWSQKVTLKLNLEGKFAFQPVLILSSQAIDLTPMSWAEECIRNQITLYQWSIPLTEKLARLYKNEITLNQFHFDPVSKTVKTSSANFRFKKLKNNMNLTTVPTSLINRLSRETNLEIPRAAIYVTLETWRWLAAQVGGSVVWLLSLDGRNISRMFGQHSSINLLAI